MASVLNPYIHFDGEAAEAVAFYHSVLGGRLEINTYAQSGFEAAGDRIMHARLETEDGMNLMAADLPPGTPAQSGSSIGISISGDDGERLRGYWEGLSAGGTVTMPLEKQMWGDEFGQCVDKFGVTWLVNINQPQ